MVTGARSVKCIGIGQGEQPFGRLSVKPGPQGVERAGIDAVLADVFDFVVGQSGIVSGADRATFDVATDFLGKLHVAPAERVRGVRAAMVRSFALKKLAARGGEIVADQLGLVIQLGQQRLIERLHVPDIYERRSHLRSIASPLWSVHDSTPKRRYARLISLAFSWPSTLRSARLCLSLGHRGH
jgi:hypothetical protein